MKKFGILGIGVLALSTACSGGGFGGDNPSYNAKILNWPATKTGYVRIAAGNYNSAVYGGSALVSADGSFSNLLFPGNATMMSTLSLPTSSTCTAGNITITPDTVKIGGAGIQVLNNANLAAGRVSELNRAPSSSNPTSAVGDKQILRIFVDGNVKISGTCSNGGSSMTYDTDLVTGWNVLIFEVTAVTGTTVTAAKFTSGALPSDIKLYYTAEGSNPLSINNLFK